MDDSPYPTSGLHGMSAAQTCLSPNAIPPNQRPSGSPLPQTLPPLQPLSGNTPYTPRMPSTPNTPNPATSVPHYQETSRPAPRSCVRSMARKPYPLNQGYGASAPMMPQTTTAASHPQPIAPGPVGRRGPPVLRPLPPGGIIVQFGVSSPYGPGTLMQPNRAPGRLAATTAGAGAKCTVISIKDADGKIRFLEVTF